MQAQICSSVVCNDDKNRTVSAYHRCTCFLWISLNSLILLFLTLIFEESLNLGRRNWLISDCSYILISFSFWTFLDFHFLLLTCVKLGCFLSELDNVIFWRRSENVVSLSIKVIQYLAIDPWIIDTCTGVKLETIEEVIRDFPFIVILLFHRQQPIVNINNNLLT